MALIPILRRYAAQLNCVDEPCERKMHGTPMPRVGGLAMAVGSLVPMMLWASKDQIGTAILIGSGIIVLFGFIDDVKELGYRTKLGAQLTAALVVVLGGNIKICCLGSLLPENVLLPNWLAIPLTIFVIIGVTNAINLSDGLDGLAGGTMLLCFICIGFLAYRAEYRIIALIAVATSGAIFGFLRFNTYPATVFMGDAGSQLLGFLSVTMALTISQSKTPISPLFPLLLLGLPVLDTLMVMIERLNNGRSPFLADKNHLHHKLLRLNFFHSEAVFIIYVLQAGLVTTAYLFRFHSDWLLLWIYLGFSFIILNVFLLANRKNWQLKRPGLIDRLVKEKLKIHIKDRFLVIKVSQIAIEAGLSLLIIITCLLPKSLPGFMSWLGVGFIILILLACLFKPSQESNALRLVVYFLIPLVVYYSEAQFKKIFNPEIILWYNLCFGGVVFFAIVTLKKTRRKAGFRATPLDFILFFVAIVIPNLPDSSIKGADFGFLAAKIIVFYYIFEVLIGEMRGRQSRFSLSIIISSFIVVLKGCG